MSATNLQSLVPEKISKEDLRRAANQEPMALQILRRKWGWIGHTLRKPASNQPCLSYCVDAQFTPRPEGKHLPTSRVCMCASSSRPLPHRPFQLGWTCQECETPTDIALGVIEARKPSHHLKVHAPGDGLPAT